MPCWAGGNLWWLRNNSPTGLRAALSQSLGRPTLACLATAINEDRNSYYKALEKVGRGEINLNGFLDYFTEAVNRAQEIARAEVAFVLDKARFYERQGDQLNERQGKVIARVFEEGRVGFKGGLAAKNYVAIAKCSPATASRDLARLRDMGALIAYGQGRGARYKIAGTDGKREPFRPLDRFSKF